MIFKLKKKKCKKKNALTNRDELSFFVVLAFPNASRIGLAASSCLSSSTWSKKQKRLESDNLLQHNEIK